MPSPSLNSRRVNLTWVLLSVITVVSWVLASTRDSSRFGPDAAVTMAVVVIAGVKARTILSEFMEVRLAPRWLQALTDFWLIALIAVIVAFYID